MNREGTGLGLSICKQLIEQQGGTVNVTSQLGKGTTFEINLNSKCIVTQTVFRHNSMSAQVEESKSPQQFHFFKLPKESDLTRETFFTFIDQNPKFPDKL